MEQSDAPDIRERPEESPEEALMASFRVAAESVAQLYKTSLNQKTKYHNTGYEQCLQDLMGFVSSHPSVQQRRQTEQLKSVTRRNRDEGINREIDCIDTGQGGIGILTGNDNLKRRYNGSSELNFLGRSTTFECSFYEPPTKKGRLRKEE
ncbi:14185_t:CDS:2 [Rhizophagus irregularis]|nr:14185_t:CDS:2 [Rhizophagus irregularis]